MGGICLWLFWVDDLLYLGVFVFVFEWLLVRFVVCFLGCFVFVVVLFLWLGLDGLRFGFYWFKFCGLLRCWLIVLVWGGLCGSLVFWVVLFCDAFVLWCDLYCVVVCFTVGWLFVVMFVVGEYCLLLCMLLPGMLVCRGWAVVCLLFCFVGCLFVLIGLRCLGMVWWWLGVVLLV